MSHSQKGIMIAVFSYKSIAILVGYSMFVCPISQSNFKSVSCLCHLWIYNIFHKPRFKNWVWLVFFYRNNLEKFVNSTPNDLSALPHLLELEKLTQGGLPIITSVSGRFSISSIEFLKSRMFLGSQFRLKLWLKVSTAGFQCNR